jgi:penicillin amidase
METEIERARRMESLPEAIFRDVFRLAPAAPTTVLQRGRTLGVGASAAASAHASGTIRAALPPAGRLAQIVATLDRVRQMNPIGRRGAGTGSNDWIVAPGLSATGHAMLANDPHLQLFNPPIWQMVQLDSAGDNPSPRDNLRVNGVNFPGLPGIILGHNDFGAWGGTVANFDTTDVYVETITTPPDYPASPRTVLFRGQQVPVLRIDEPFQVKGSAAITRVIEVVPHHGPMVPDPDPEDDVVGIAASGMSFRWSGHEITLDSKFLTNLNRARNVTEFRGALANFAAGAQNWVWADVNGDIAYFPYVLVPQRPAGVVPYLPVPGTGEAEWLADENGNTQWLPADRFPQALNPPEGFVNTSNNDQTGATLDDDPLNDGVYLGFDEDLGFRAQRVRELLTNDAGLRAPGAKIGMSDMSRYQFENQSKEAERFLPFLFAAAENRPDLVTPAMSAALERLRGWGVAKAGTEPGAVAFDAVSGVDASTVRSDVPQRATPVSAEEREDAVATSIFFGWLSRLSRLTLADDFADTGVGVPGGQDATKALLHILEDVQRTDALRVYTLGADGQSTLWDDRTTPEVETRDQILLAALREGLVFLTDEFKSDDPSGWLWGLIHQVRFQHFLGQGGIDSYDLALFPAPGGRFSVNPADFSLNSDDFSFSDGPSMRFVVDLDPAGIRAVNVLPGGNNGNPGGEGAENFNRINPAIHYGDHVPEWLNGETFTLHVSREDVAQHSARHIRYVP